MKRVIAALMLATLPTAAAAQSPQRALPSFALTDATGATTSSRQLSDGRRAVLVVIRPSCRPCERLVDALARLDDPALASRLVFIIESPHEDAAAFAARRLPASLASVPWFADGESEAWHALALKGLPKIIGVEGRRIGWTHSGVPEGTLLESLLRTWSAPAEELQ
jgi:hypothetical protein